MTITEYLIENRWTIGLVFWSWTLATFLLTSVRRAFIDTPAGLYHPKFVSMGWPEETDEADKLHRVAVALTLLVQFMRVGWVILGLAHRIGTPAWYLPESADLAFWLMGLVTAVELVILSTVLHELLPQVVSTWKGRVVAIALLRPLCQFELLVSPVSRGFRWLRGALLRFVGSPEEQTEAELAHEGIRAAVEAGEREGVLQAGEKSMIESVLEFREAEIIEVMTPRTEMVCFDNTITLSEAVAKAIECGHSRIPVYRDNVDHIVGVLYVKDLLRFFNDETTNGETPIQSVVRKINFVPETKKIQELLAEFRASRFHIAVVLDEYGGTSGLVTIEDIIEEIVGDIEDEYDVEETDLIQSVDAHTFELDGRAPIDDVEEVAGVELPENDDYETVGGFLMSTLGRVPQEGDRVDMDAFSFEVTSADERKVKRVLLRLDASRESVSPVSSERSKIA